MRRIRLMLLPLCLLALAFQKTAFASDGRIKALWLGDKGHHQPAARLTEILPALTKAGIDIAYTDDMADISSANLSSYDALIIYANQERISPEQEEALLEFVESGKGLVVLHCGSFCFLNSPRYVALVGGQFQKHETGTFTAQIDKPDHPALAGVEPFEAFDETYVHAKLTDDRNVLMHRDDNGRKESWTWVRTQGKGRVFYTASGHDERVFTHPGFHKLVIAGLRWAADRPGEIKLPALSYKDSGADIPNYVKSRRWGEQGKPHRQMQEPLPPADSQKHLSVPGRLATVLYAAEPSIVKPICISWDDRGRLWVAESVDYPNNKQPDGQGHDRIKICQDTDGDGVADTFKVFAKTLSIPTSMVHVPGGVIVTHAPDVLLLADKDGDDKADLRKVLFTGFHTDDTHAGPSNLRLGFDGWIYATVGYAGFDGEVGGQAHHFRQNLFRFKPDGSKLEVLTSTSNNTWGLGLTETNEIVYSTANGEHSSYLGQPNAAFESVRGWLGRGNARMADHDNMHPATAIRQVDWFGGFTAAAGHAVYTARQFPPIFWDRAAFICEPTGHLVHLCQLERDGSHLISRDRFNLLASTDEWTAPIIADVGPDGAVWVVDWYNYIVQHNPTPLGFKTGRGNAYETPLRDKVHGRVYRVVNTEAPLGNVLDLTTMTSAQLVDVLKNDNMLWRMKAQWNLIAKKDPSAVPLLLALVKQAGVDATGQSPAALQALWTLWGLGAIAAPDGEAARAVALALQHPASGVRRAAVEVMTKNEQAADAILSAGVLADPDPVVRREALRALAACPPNDLAGAAIAQMLGRPENARDRWIPLAATTAAARHDIGFLVGALGLADAPQAVLETVRRVAEHRARGGESVGLPRILAALEGASTPVSEAVLAGYAAGWPENKHPELDRPTIDRLVARMDGLAPASQQALALLAQRWGFGERVESVLARLREALAGEASDESKPDRERIASAQRLAQLNPDRSALEALLALIGPKASPALSAGVLDAAAQSGSAELGEVLLSSWVRFTPDVRRQTIETLMRRPGWTRNLVDALEAGTLATNDLAIDQGQRLMAHPEKELAGRSKVIFERGGRLPSPDREAVLAELVPLCEKTGDAAHGKEVFVKNCAKCHRHGGEGETIGPDLTGFVVHPKSKILEEMIDPNRSVEGNFRQYTVATTDGQVMSGLLAAETRTAIELVDSEAKRHIVLRDDIDEMIASPKSLMPEGFEKQISSEEIIDLLEFLTAKGKYVPLPIDKAATVVSTRGMFYSKDAEAERLIFPDWSPKTAFDVPFQLVDPRGDRVPNVIVLNSRSGPLTTELPKSVTIPCNTPAKAIHLLSGVSGWGFPAAPEGSVSMIVRLHYADGDTEDIALKNGQHFADYIRRVDVPGSEFAFNLRGRQIRYLSVTPKREAAIESIELVKGDDPTAPIVMAVTVEGR
jgi:putative membrane-bound dehydrogenase-like protein